MRKMLLLQQGEKKKTVSILSDGFCEEHAISYLIPKGKLGYNAARYIPISSARYFNQRLLNFKKDLGLK